MYGEELPPVPASVNGETNTPRPVVEVARSIRTLRQWFSTRTLPLKPTQTAERGISGSTAGVSEPGSPKHFDMESTANDEGKREEIVGHGGIKRVENETMFESSLYGFRIRIQKESIRGKETAGPIAVSTLQEKIKFEGRNLEGILKVECLPGGCRFGAPLLFDFPVRGEDTSNPIMDEHGRIRYEFLTKNSESGEWVKDPESSMAPLKVVQEGDKIYVRAEVRHFSCFSLWKRIEVAPQVFKKEKIPFPQREKHQSLVQNKSDVHIHVYVMRLSQWNAALETAKAGGGVEGFNANFEVNGNAGWQTNAAALIPQFVTIPPGMSHWFEIPRRGLGVVSRRKAAVCIVTETSDHKEGRRMRMEAMVRLRGNRSLTVNLPVENGQVYGTPAASESGGILSQVMCVINNLANSGVRPPSDVTLGTRSPVGGGSAPFSTVFTLATLSPQSSSADEVDD